MIPGVSLASLGVSAGGLLVYGTPSVADGLAAICAVSAFVFICSVEALLAS